jgi:hypothetical protein
MSPLLLRSSQDDDPIGELRMALNQSQPIGNPHFYAQIESATCQREKSRSADARDEKLAPPRPARVKSSG